MQVNFITILLLILILIIIYHFFVSTNTENFINSEDFINKKKLTLYIFLSKKCPHCIDYENNHHKKIVDDLGSNYDIKKIYSDDDKDGLFNKFNIRYVPKGVLEQDGNVVEVKGQVRSGVVQNAATILNKLVTDMENTKTINNLVTNMENIKTINKKKLLVFLSKTCPHCVNYIQNKHKQLVNELGNEFSIELVYSDEDPDNLFDKYNINYVPKGVLEQDGKVVEVKGPLISEVVKNSAKMLNNLVTNMENTINKKKLLVFLSKTCHHCVNYIKNTHNQLVNELGNEFSIELVHSDEDSDNLFNKYNVNYVPKGIVISNGKEYEVKGHLKSENIRNTDKSINIEHMELDEINDDINGKINNNINSTTNSETNDETNNKKKLLVFLSKTCPHCVTYENVTHKKLLNELDNKFVIQKVYSDEDTNELFNKHNIKYVPKAIVISNGKEYQVNGLLKSENIMNADKSVIEKSIKDKSMNIEHMEHMENDKKNLLIFLSKTCPHCVTYDNSIHEKLKMELGNECNIKKIYNDKDTDGLFNKYNIRYVPAGIILSRERHIPIEGVINIENIKEQIKKLKN